VDRQRNDDDCLGRNYWRRLRYGHRRQILRRWTESDTDANSFSQPNRDSYGDCHSNSDGDGHRNCNSNSNSNAYGYTHGFSKLHAEACADSEASPDARATTLEVAN
jgi:hypothetical protein